MLFVTSIYCFTTLHRSLLEEQRLLFSMMIIKPTIVQHPTLTILLLQWVRNVTVLFISQNLLLLKYFHFVQIINFHLQLTQTAHRRVSLRIRQRPIIVR